MAPTRTTRTILAFRSWHRTILWIGPTKRRTTERPWWPRDILVTDDATGVTLVRNPAMGAHDGDLLLESGETWVSEATGIAETLTDPGPGVTVVLGTCDTVTDVPVYENVGTLAFLGGTLDIDPSHYCNPLGTINIVATTDPSGGSGFSFMDNVPGSAGSFFLDDGDTMTFSMVPAGSYSVMEDYVTPGAFVLDSIMCNDAGSANESFGDVPTETASIGLDPGESVTCTFHLIDDA